MYSAKSSFFSLWTLSEELLSEFSVILDSFMFLSLSVCVHVLECICLKPSLGTAYLFLGLTNQICKISTPFHKFYMKNRLVSSKLRGTLDKVNYNNKKVDEMLKALSLLS